MDETINVSDLLKEELVAEFEKLGTLTPGTKEYEAVSENVTKLYKLMVEETEMWSKVDKEDRDKSQRIDKIIEYSLKGAQIVLPLIFYSVWMKRGFEFEKEGTYTSMTFKGLFNKFKPTKVD